MIALGAPRLSLETPNIIVLAQDRGMRDFIYRMHSLFEHEAGSFSIAKNVYGRRERDMLNLSGVCS